MNDFVQAIGSALSSKNWYAALIVAISVPDICGYLETPETRSQSRYEDWFDRYMLSKYQSHVGAANTPHTFLSASDCYALRCALLHEGRDEIVEQRAREASDRFYFKEPPPSGSIHLNQVNTTLQLQVDLFCKDILDGVRRWMIDTQSNNAIQSRMTNVLRIHP